MASTVQSEVSRSYNSFSGSDIRAMIGPFAFAELQAVSYSVSREKAPIYTMGTADPRAFSRNKRGVAGSLIWINFDRHALLNLIWQAGGQFCANVDDLRPQYLTDLTGAANQLSVGQGALFASTLNRSPNGNNLSAAARINQFDTSAQQLNSTSGLKDSAKPWYSDQILPFDITLQGTNEIGAATGMKIWGVEILNEGSGVSIDDAVQEMQATFVARSIEPWTAVETGTAFSKFQQN